MKKVMVIAPHPDDETLGCGGTLLKHKDFGDKIYWQVLTKTPEHQDKMIVPIGNKYGFEDIFKEDIPEITMDEYPFGKIVGKIGDTLDKVKPEVLYIPFKDDIHTDHRISFNAIYSAIKTFRRPYIKKVLMMEIVSQTEFGLSPFIPNYFVDVTNYFGEKLAIIRLYDTEIAEHPFPRNIKNIEGIALFRGAISGSYYAEAFMILKEIW